MSKSLTDKTLSGLNWNFLGNYILVFIQTCVGIILARLLMPKDFGLIGMVTIFTGLADLFATFGMKQSIIRIKNITENHLRVATTITISASFLIYLIFYFSSPLIAAFYDEPRLIPIIKVLSFLFILKGLTVISTGQVHKNLDFKFFMIINIVSSLFYGLTSTIMALFGFGVWSLVIGTIASSITNCLLLLRKFPPKLRPLIKREELKELAGFGSGVSLSNILLYGSSNIDYLIIGKFTDPTSLGLYTRAFRLMTQSIDKVIRGSYGVLFAAFSAVQDEKEKLRKAYLRTIKTVAFIVFPLLSVIAVNADYVIKGMYGIKWAGAVPVFRILAIAGIFRATLSFSGAIAHATGKVYSEALQQLMYLLVLGGGALYAVKYGIAGVALAVVVAIVCLFIAQSYLAIKIIESNWKEFFKSMLPGLANILAVVSINLMFVGILEKYFGSIINEIKLVIAVVFNFAIFVALIVFMPSSIKGDTFIWLMDKYKKFIPALFVKFYNKFNTQK